MIEKSSNGRTTDSESVYDGSNPSFSANYVSVAELADAPDSKSGSFGSVGSNPTTHTNVMKGFLYV